MFPAPSRVILGLLISAEQTAAPLSYGCVLGVGVSLPPHRLSDLETQSAHSPTTPQCAWLLTHQIPILALVGNWLCEQLLRLPQSHSQGFKGHMGQANHRVAQLCPVSSFPATGFFLCFSVSINIGQQVQAADSRQQHQGSARRAENRWRWVVRTWESALSLYLL